MNRNKMLKEHLDGIYISEDVKQATSKLKSKTDDISDAAKNGNVLRLNKIFEKLPEMSISQLRQAARKQTKNELSKSEKLVNAKMKKAPDSIKLMIAIGHASLNSMKNKTDDPELSSKIDDSIQKLDGVITKIAGTSLTGGMSLILFASLLSVYVSASVYLAGIIAAGGGIMIEAAIILYLCGLLVKLFIGAKKVGKRMIS